MLAIDGRRHLSLHYCFVHRTFSIAHPRIRCNNFLLFCARFLPRGLPRTSERSERVSKSSPKSNHQSNHQSKPISYPYYVYSRKPPVYHNNHPPFISIYTPRLFLYTPPEKSPKKVLTLNVVHATIGPAKD